MTAPSEGLLRALLAAAPDALLAVDPAGAITFVNDQVERLFGWSAEELVGAPVETLVPETASARHVEHRSRYVEDPVARPMGAGTQLSARRKDGSTFPAEISLSAMTDDLAGLLVLVAVRDVSDRLELEAERRRHVLARQREQSPRLEILGQLAGGVAHDFNNLLGVIMNYTTLVARRVDDPVVIADLEEIRAAVDRAAGLSRQLVTFASLDVVASEALEVGGVVEGVAMMLARTLGEHIELRVDLWPAPLVAVADRHQLEQIIVNLVLNARDAMPSGGAVTIETRRVASAVGPDCEMNVADVALIVTDAGTGMSSDVVARAFEPFFTTKPAGAGTGVGLATVHGIVQQHGGTVTIDSTEGQGTTVTVILRGAHTPTTGPQPDPPRAAHGGSEHILVVEDEEAFRIGTARVLTANGYEVSTAVDGLDALALVEADGPIDLVVTDVAMPRMRGDEMADRLAEIRPDLPVIFISGYPPGTARRVEPLLAKPVPEDVLLRTIRGALGG